VNLTERFKKTSITDTWQRRAHSRQSHGIPNRIKSLVNASPTSSANNLTDIDQLGEIDIARGDNSSENIATNFRITSTHTR
jgi:hypothetical protein